MTFEEILQDFSISYRSDGANTREGWLQLDCSECGGHLYLGYNVRGKYLNCWKCGSVPLVRWLRDVTGQSYQNCRTLLDGVPREFEQFERQHQGKLVLPEGVGPLLQCHTRYLQKRGFDTDTLVKIWKIGGIGLDSRFPWRLFIPVHYRGEVVSWVTRSLVDSGSRYIAASPQEEKIPLKELLYGEDYCRHATVVVEGCIDAWKIGPGAVATFGTGFTVAQVNRIAKYPLRIICFDTELKAQSQARQLCHALSLFPGETINVTLDSKDPGEALPREIRKLRRFLE